jgi:hypothetical protein
MSAKIDASHYRDNPKDNSGLPSYVERTVINERIGGSLSYPFVLSNVRSLSGTVTSYASHDEDRFNNTTAGATIGLRSQVRALQLQADYGELTTGQARKASINVAKVFDILGADMAGDSNVPGTTTVNPAF